MRTHNIGFYVGEAILMSTHNIGFYEDLTKIISELINYHQISSNTHLISSAVTVLFAYFQRPFVCSYENCFKSYARQQHLKRHEELSHNSKVDDVEESHKPSCR